MNGDQFRCVVANGGGSATSGQATLTVLPPAGLTLVISQPLDGAIITRVAGSPATSVPFTFTATHGGGAITSLAAKLGAKSLTVNSSGLGTATATGAGTFQVRAGGTYTFTASATGSGGLTATASTTVTVRETEAAPICSVEVDWIGVLAGDGTLKGGKSTALTFRIQECCTTFGSRGHGPHDDDGHGDHHGGDCVADGRHDKERHGRDEDRNDGNKKKDPAPAVSSSDRGDKDGQSRSKSNDTGKGNGHGHDEGREGRSDSRHSVCSYLQDRTVVVTISELFSNGSSGPPKSYTYTSGSPGSAQFTIDRNGHYELKFVPASSGRHTYLIEVDRFPADSPNPVLAGSTTFKSK
jgi:hypothetical protein